MLWLWLRRWWKFLLRCWTGRHELERILRAPEVDHARFRRSVLRSKRLPRSAALMGQHDAAMSAREAGGWLSEAVDIMLSEVALAKLPSPSSAAAPLLGDTLLDRARGCVEVTLSVNALCMATAAAARLPVVRKGRDEELLSELYALLVEKKDAGAGRSWPRIGFQGRDPATDFRGMGRLALMQLVYYARTRPEEARRGLERSEHATKWWPFAVTGINITKMIADKVAAREFDAYFWERLREPRPTKCDAERLLLFRAEQQEEEPTAEELRVLALMEVHADLYAYIFTQWADYWEASAALTPMDFGPVFRAFSAQFPGKR